MIRIVRLLAYLSVFMLVLSGGIYTHADDMHVHAAASSKPAQGSHVHADGTADTVDKADLHCGASILSLAMECRLPLRRKTLEVSPGEDGTIRQADAPFELPPPKTTS
ncbi:hypothetical protein [Roseibium salinum]|uniref:Uncharacterized protein n=1 Tax=Roseibium salinum TaxID=1604349 RepID=A0ABT3R9J7_9HYPH|nr:hypothetical protein [Roseibium sp. DSM 29163]MCX2725731.1 hypothetical protein [Roseibium sp. DSM 29163]